MASRGLGTNSFAVDDTFILAQLQQSLPGLVREQELFWNARLLGSTVKN
jgi:hypothetical protein